MNPNQPAYEALKRWQKALSLTDSDTQLVPPNSGQENQSPANPKDVEFYKKQYQEAIERGGYPLSDRDRRELESLQQVLHLRDEDVQAIEQQLVTSKTIAHPQYADTVLQNNETRVEASRAILNEPDPRVEPADFTEATSQNADSRIETATAQKPLPQTAATSQNTYGEQLQNQTPNKQAINRRLAEGEAQASEAAGTMEQRAAETAAYTSFEADPNQAQPIPAESGTVPESASGNQPLNPAADGITPGPAPDLAQNPPGRQKPATVKGDRRPLLITIGLLGATLGILAGTWLAITKYWTPPKRDPAAASRYFQAGTQQAQQGQTSQGIKALDEAIRLNPNDPHLFSNRGVAYYQARNFSAALSDYNQALKLNPNFAEALSNRSQLHVAERRYDEAIADANQAIALNPNLTEAYLNRGNALFGKNNLDGATQDYQTVLRKTDPANQSKAYNNLGNVNAARNQLDTAIKNYEQAIELVRSYADPFFNRALALERVNRCPEAVQGFRDAEERYRNQGNSEMRQRAQNNAERLQQCITPPGGASPQPSPSPTPSV